MPPPPSSESNKAVFLSYASEDAVAAKSIAGALTAAGVEVWFDQSDLRGGEAWDRSIRRQIKECALFLPVVSANTQARPEGYFRLEWHLAEQRSLLIAKGRPFIVPVTIDALSDRDALVPDAFLAVQWTRLLGGEAPPQFAEQLKRLLDGDKARDSRLSFGMAQGLNPAERPPSSEKAWFGDPALPKDGPPQITDYDLLRLIGQGSYGDVWLARSVTGIYRAIKVVWRARFKDAQPYEREFRGLKEFAAMSLGESIQMALLHVGRNDTAGFFYYVMELADDVDRGRDIDPAHYVPLTLNEVRARNGRVRVPAKDCLQYGVELARVLAGLHRRGLIHRDIKPANVILVSGVPKLADIGLVTRSDSTMTYVGTEGFVPPEGPGSASADIFALGRLLYELATGLDRTEFPQLPADLNKLPDHRLLLELNEIILKACDPVAANRYRDGAALLADLSALQAGSSIRRRRIGAGLMRVVTVAAAILAVAAVAYWQWPSAAPAPSSLLPAPSQTPDPKSQAPDPKSVAVLAFSNLSGDSNNEYFSDGISEELLTVLQKIPGLRVTARTSAFSFKGGKATAQEIGQKLGVAHLVDGSVRRQGDEVRITVNLSRAGTGEQLWSESYTRKLRDIFAVQSEIAETVVAQIRGQLSGEKPGAASLAAIRGQVRVAGKGGTTNLEAYDLYLQGKFFVNRGSPADSTRPVDLYKRAIALDPGFALAHAGLAIAYINLRNVSVSKKEGDEFYRLAGQTLDRALALEPNLAEGHAARSSLLSAGMVDWRGADQALRRALALAPDNPDSVASAALMRGSIFGQVDQGMELARQSLDLDPLNVNSMMQLGGFYAAKGRFKEAEDLKRRVIKLNPDAMSVHGALAFDYLYQGRFDEAVELVQKEKLDYFRLTVLAQARWGQGKVAESDEALRGLKALGDWVAVPVMMVYAYRNELDQAFAWFERAIQLQDSGLLICKIDPMMVHLRKDPRWAVMLRKLGLHDDQLAEFLPDLQKPPFVPVVPVTPAWIVEKQKTASSAPSLSHSPLPDARSVAVLAFNDLSADKGHEYFSDGISEELLTVLQKIPGLRVTARTSAFSFKGSKATASEIGQKLGVAHLVEGSVRRQGDQVRITVSLSRAATGEQLWSESYTRKLQDIFAVQSEIAETVVAQIRGRLTGEAPDAAALFAIRGQVKTATKGGTNNVAAFEQYLQGRFHANLDTMEDFARAEGFFRRATELDPAYALAYVELARAHISQGQFTVVLAELTRHFALAAQALDRAQVLEPTLAEGLGAKAELLIWSKYDWRGADQAVRQARALAPRDPDILSTAARLAMITGQIDQSIALGRQALEIDPLNQRTMGALFSCYATQRRYPEAAALRRRALELNPQAMQVHEAQADDYVMQGRFDEAVEELQKAPPGWFRDFILSNALWGQGKIAESEEALNRVKALGDIAGGVVGFAYAYRQDADQAFAWLERGLHGGDVGVLNSKVHSATTSLQADPRWPVWLRKLGLHDDQLSEFMPDFKETKFTPPAVSPPKGAAPITLPPASLRSP